VLPRPDGSIVYELTEYGRQLEDTVLALGRWGARSLADPRPDEIVTTDSLIMAVRTTFGTEAASGLHAGFELRLGEIVVGVRIDDGVLQVAEGPLPDADLVIDTGPVLRALLAGQITPEELTAGGYARLRGNTDLLARFVEVFRIAPAPAAAG
jgi:hypothetical protein